MLPFFVLLQGLLISAASAGGFSFFTKVPIEYINPRDNPHPSCPLSTHILGHGVAPSIEEARKGARADVVRQIRSNIYTQAQRTSTATQSKTKQTSSTSLTTTIVEESTFPYAEKIVDLGKTYKKKKQYYALSCLEKQPTAQHIYNRKKEDIDRLLARFDAHNQLYLKQDRAAFTSQYSQTNALFDELSSDLLWIRTLYPLPQVENVISRQATFRRETNELHSSMAIGIFSTLAAAQSSLDEIISDNNINTFPTAKACVDQQTHFASIRIQPDCNIKMGNHFCSLDILYTILDCSSQKSIAHTLPNNVVGADSRKKERALANAYKKIDFRALEEKIQHSIRTFSPLVSDSLTDQ